MFDIQKSIQEKYKNMKEVNYLESEKKSQTKYSGYFCMQQIMRKKLTTQPEPTLFPIF